MRPITSCCAWILIIICVASVGPTTRVRADEVRQPQARSSPPAKLFVTEMRAKPWAAVFEWLTDQTGIPFVSKYPPPAGTIHFIAKAGQSFTLGEVIDLLNDGLQAHKYVLLRNPTCFRLLPADERIDKSLVPPVTLDELPQRGKSEIVEIMLPLRFLPADEYAADVKKMLGLFGEVVVLRHGNRLLMHDTAGNLRRIVELTKELEDAQTRTITLDRHSAAGVAELLRRVVPELGGYPVKVNVLK